MGLKHVGYSHLFLGFSVRRRLSNAPHIYPVKNGIKTLVVELAVNNQRELQSTDLKGSLWLVLPHNCLPSLIPIKADMTELLTLAQIKKNNPGRSCRRPGWL